MKKKVLLSVLIVAVSGVFVALQLRAGRTSDTTTELDAATSSSTEPALADPLIIGQSSAKAVIVEYADYKCPACVGFHEKVGKRLEQDYIQKGLLKVVLHPVSIIGPDSARAARGALCAQKQNKLKEYHYGVMEHMWTNYYSKEDYSVEFEEYLTNTKLTDIASTNGIDGVLFNTCLDDVLVTDQQSKIMSDAKKNGVNSTPTFIINNQRVLTPRAYEDFKLLVDIQL